MEITDLVLIEKLEKIAKLYGFHYSDLFTNSRDAEIVRLKYAIYEVLFSADKKKYNKTRLGEMFRRHYSTVIYGIKQSEFNRSYDSVIKQIYKTVEEILVL